MNRRDFLRRLVVGTVGATASIAAGLELDPERLLWVPGQKTFFLPPAPSIADRVETAFRQRGPHVLLTPDWLAREALKVLEDQIAFAKTINRRYDAAFQSGKAVMAMAQHDLAFVQGDQWPRVGETIDARLPARYRGDL